jgi:signal peptide peptidase SppA
MGRRAFSRAAITRRLFNAPLAVLPDTAAVVLGAIGEKFDVAQLFVATDGRQLSLGELEALAADERSKIEARGGVDRKAPMMRASDLMFIQEGVAHVDVRGELVAENGIGPMSGFTGYDGICAQVAAADADSQVRGIVLDIDSPGGEVAGLYECAAKLMARRGTKPMRAVVRGMGCSAAYALACCADEVTLHELGYAGSIGTILMHVDFSEKLKTDGVKVTLIAAGSHKADGNPFEPLPDDVRSRFETLIQSANDRFIAHVAAARGLDAAAVRGQQAEVFQGEEAVAAGLADKVMSWSDSFDEFIQQVNGGGRAAKPAPGARSSKELNMDEKNGAPAADTTPVYTEAQMSAAKTEAASAAATAAIAAERERVTQLAELDSDSTISASLGTAISAGTSAGDFAIALAKDAKTATATALEAAKNDAVKGDELPGKGAARGSGSGDKVNRGEAAVARLRGKIPGLPARAG